MKVSDYIIHYFEQQKIGVIFGYIGGMITHLVDSITANKHVQFVQTYHEQTAAIAAEGYAIGSGRFGVAISTSGPGATNMLTGIADAYFGSVPVVYLTGQVNTYEYKYDKPVRQLGFQETDVVSIVRPVTKYAHMIDQATDIRYELEKAVFLATTGRKGPVLLDIPMDIQRSEINPDCLRSYLPPTPKVAPEEDIAPVLSLLRESRRPILLLGAGCRDSRTRVELEKLLQATELPVVTSLMGRGCIDETYPHYLGMIGSYGNRCANMGIADADLLIALGSRLDVRQTGAMLTSFLPKGRIIHVDIDPNELDHHRLDNRLSLCCDVYSLLQKLNKQTLPMRDFRDWKVYLHHLQSRYNQKAEIERFVVNKSPYRLMQTLMEYSREGDIFSADIGQNQMWAAQTLQLKKRQQFITSGGLAPMGFSLPVSIGLSFANPVDTIYSINGDGGFHMAVQSLMLISQYNLPIKVIVMNNRSLGMITQFQQLYFGGRMSGTTPQGGYLVPDIRHLAASYGLPYFLISEKELQDRTLLKAIFSSRNAIIEYTISGLTTVSPKLEYNKPIDQPTPQLPEEEYEDSKRLLPPSSDKFKRAEERQFALSVSHSKFNKDQVKNNLEHIQPI